MSNRNRRTPNTSELICPFCDEGASKTATVCRGCQAEIVHGETDRERTLVRRGNFLFGLIFAALIHLVIPFWWIFPLVILLYMAALERVDTHEGEIRYFRTFRN